MPCPEKFRESLIKFDVDASIIDQINTGFEQVVSSTPKKIKASYFKRAIDIMDEKVDAGKRGIYWTGMRAVKAAPGKKHPKPLPVKIRSFRGRKDWLK